MAKTIAIKPEEEFARAYVDRLILEKLTEMEEAVKLGELADKLSANGIGLSTVRSLLASNPDRFAYHERRWIPASRLRSLGRPLEEVLVLILDGFRGPISMSLLYQEVARVRGTSVADIAPTVDRLIERGRQFVRTPDDAVALLRWSFVAHDERVPRALALNQLTLEQVQEVQEKVKDIDFRTPGAIAQALEKVAPVSLRALGAAVWLSVNSEDPRSVLIFDAADFYGEILGVKGYVFGGDGVLYPQAEVKKWVATAVKLADRLAPSVEMDDAAPIEVKGEDIEKLVAKVLASETSLTATRLLEENYEITPSNKTFPDDLANMMAALKSSDKVMWVGGDRVRRANDLPDFINEVPEPFQFVQTTVTDEEGELIDVELTDEGLSSSLRKLLSHPLALDVVDEDIQPAPKTMPETVRLVLKSIHRELGTFPLAQIPTGWLDPQPNIQELIFVDPAGRELQVWINHEARLMYNLIDWWYEQPVESGAVFTLTKTPKPNVLEFAYLDQPDPVVHISSPRMEELRQLGAAAEGRSTLDLLIDVMGHWPKGADYLTILAEVNVVRRASRRLIASLLSSYQCFYQRSGSPVWHFDAKKVDQGFDKTKRKFIKK